MTKQGMVLHCDDHVKRHNPSRYSNMRLRASTYLEFDNGKGTGDALGARTLKLTIYRLEML